MSKDNIKVTGQGGGGEHPACAARPLFPLALALPLPLPDDCRPWLGAELSSHALLLPPTNPAVDKDVLRINVEKQEEKKEEKEEGGELACAPVACVGPCVPLAHLPRASSVPTLARHPASPSGTKWHRYERSSQFVGRALVSPEDAALPPAGPAGLPLAANARRGRSFSQLPVGCLAGHRCSGWPLLTMLQLDAPPDRSACPRMLTWTRSRPAMTTVSAGQCCSSFDPRMVAGWQPQAVAMLPAASADSCPCSPSPPQACWCLTSPRRRARRRGPSASPSAEAADFGPDTTRA